MDTVYPDWQGNPELHGEPHHLSFPSEANGRLAFDPLPDGLPDAGAPRPALAVSAFDALPGNVAVVGACGTLLAVNRNWRRFAECNGLPPSRPGSDNYLRVCDEAQGEDAALARAAGDGLRQVLAGHLPDFELDYPCSSPEQERWFRMRATPITTGPEPAALVIHTDITSEVGLAQSRRAMQQLIGASVVAWTYEDGRGLVFTATPGTPPRLPVGVPLRSAAALRLVVPHHRQAVLQALRRAQRHGRPIDVEVELLVRGRPTWVRIIGELARGRTGRPRGVLQWIDDRKRMEASLRETAAALLLVGRCHEMLVRATGGQELQHALCDIAVGTGGFRAAWVAAATGDEPLRCIAQAQVPPGFLAPGLLAWRGSLVRDAIRRRRLQFIPDVATSPRHARWLAHYLAHGIQGVVAIPLENGGHVAAALVLYLGTPRVLAQRELDTLASIGRDAGYALEALRMRDERAAALARIAEQAELLDRAADAITVRGTDHRVLYWNAGATRLYGWSAAEALGTDVRDLMFRQCPQYKPSVEQLAREGRIHAEFDVVRRDGSRCWVSAAWTLVRGEGGTGDRMLAICSDITPRKRMEAELARNRMLLQTAMAVAQLASAELAPPSGRVQSWTGAPAVLGLQDQPRCLEDVLSGLAPHSARAFHEAMREPAETAGELELEVADPAGSRWLRVRRAPAAPPAPAHLNFVFQDITAVREARESVLRLNAELEHRVEQRTRDLEAANRELAAFSYSVSHDLKAPLAAIDGFVHLLQGRLQGRIDERETRYLDSVRTGVANMFVLIESMLGLARLTQDAPFVRERVDLSPVCEEIVAELRAQEPERQARVTLQPGMWMWCDKALMTVALRNLIGNAWKFSRHKPLTVIEVTTRPGPGGASVVLQVADQGAGFDPHSAARLFAPFQRLHRASDFAGTGIGLATVQRVVNRHGGTLAADGEPGVGAVFTITLPQRREPGMAVPEPA